MTESPMSQSTYTIGRHLMEQQKSFAGSTGHFTSLMWDLTIAFKVISTEVNKAGLVDVLGLTGETNVHGEGVKKLDIFAHDTIFKCMDHGGHLCLMASEESPDILPIPPKFEKGEYILLFDPLDGSSNIDVNVSVGSIFSILRKKVKVPTAAWKTAYSPEPNRWQRDTWSMDRAQCLSIPPEKESMDSLWTPVSVSFCSLIRI